MHVSLYQALDINSDGYISKQELMVASQVTIIVINQPFYKTKASLFLCHKDLESVWFSQRTGRRLSKPEVDATFREFDQNKVNWIKSRFDREDQNFFCGRTTS